MEETSTETLHHAPKIREREIGRLIANMPLSGYNMHSPRVFTIWGDPGVGKSSFVSLFRDSEAMREQKILWLQPSHDANLNTPQEFIATCAAGVCYPQSPDKEEALAEKIENSQRGKINPVVSDDSILITRPEAALKKGPYINEAAAASVGRTKHKRADIQVSVGLGDNPAGNQAEAFLDALPLQSLGTDATILHIPDWQDLAITVRDWFCDYVVPAATKGPYRRNLILLTESVENDSYRSELDTWGDWEELTYSFKLDPLSEDDVRTLTVFEGLDSNRSHFIYAAGCGYPKETYDWIRALHSQSGNSAVPSLDLPNSELARLAACCLPNELHSDELDALFGPGKGKETLDGLLKLGLIPQQPEEDSSKALSIETNFRAHVIAQAHRIPAFQDIRSRYLPYGRTLRNIPNKNDRAKLFQLSCLRWIDKTSAQALFPSKADSVLKFIDSVDQYFVRKRGHFMISERLRSDLHTTATNIGNKTTQTLSEKAQSAWELVTQTITEKLEQNLELLNTTQEEADHIHRKQSEAEAYLRSLAKKSETLVDAHASHIANQPSNGNVTATLFALSAASLVATAFIPSPYNIVALLAGLISGCLGLAQLPRWVEKRRIEKALHESQNSSETERIVRERDHLTQLSQKKESNIDAIRKKIKQDKELLEYPYI